MEHSNHPEPLRKSRRRIQIFAISFAVLILIIFSIIIVPVFKSAKQEAQIITCESNLRLLGIALRQYGDDNNKHLPPSGKWANCISGYVHNRGLEKQSIFHCPAATQTLYGYGLNENLGQQNEKLFTNPSTVVLLFDSKSTTLNAYGSNLDVAWARHPGGVNIGYADSHIRHILGTSEHPNVDGATLEWSP